ncbi:MAG: nickel pincer cofactor biosynthesis protein LarC [Abditibacteriota bacterium]|nr:nickel pincer cofactor biosynthesis protein LarC [Abditibacteriota bacterium]
MKVLYFDLPSGISGDMALGALTDLGADPRRLEEALSTLGLSDKYTLRFGRKNSCGIDCCDVSVDAACEHAHRTFGDIRRIIEASGLSEKARERSLAVFHRLAAAEGRVHGKDPEEVHFHEVGAVDSIVDICGFAVCLELLEIGEIRFGTLPAFSGTTECAHGTIPLPAPAVCELTKGLLFGGGPSEYELVTPTGAAILGEGSQKPVTGARLAGAGYGSGKRDTGRPNYLRALLYETEEAGPEDRVLEIVFETDDMTPELYPALSEALYEAGALEVFSAGIMMKKGRPGLLVTVLAPVSQKEQLADAIFANSTTIGFRYSEKERVTLEREETSLSTPWGSVKAKRTLYRGKTANLKPEAEDCRHIARENGLTLKQVYDSLKQP